MVKLTPYNNVTPNSNWDTFYTFKNIFTDDMISRLEKMITNYEFHKGRTGITELGSDTDSYETNNRDIAYIVPSVDSYWLYELLFPLALEANDSEFHFDIDTVTDPIHYIVYPENGGHLDWHIDIAKYNVNRRKLAMTVQLSDPTTDYEGGELEIWMGGKDGFVTVPLEKGDVVIFPTFLMHRVKPIKKGERKCLIFWTGGRPFR